MRLEEETLGPSVRIIFPSSASFSSSSLTLPFLVDYPSLIPPGHFLQLGRRFLMKPDGSDLMNEKDRNLVAAFPLICLLIIMLPPPE